MFYYAGTREEHRWRKWQKIFTDFPWLYAVKSNWDYKSDNVRITNNFGDLKVLLLSPARDESVEIWIYGETMYPPRIFCQASWVVKASHSDGKTLWAEQVAGNGNPYEVVRYVVVKFAHDSHYTIYRDKEDLNLEGWINRLSETHPF
jgi:hypothetical protein